MEILRLFLSYQLVFYLCLTFKPNSPLNLTGVFAFGRRRDTKHIAKSQAYLRSYANLFSPCLRGLFSM